jgi:hypothetical protein
MRREEQNKTKNSYSHKRAQNSTPREGKKTRLRTKRKKKEMYFSFF